MSRTLTSRLTATGLLTLTAAAAGLVFAPGASAAGGYDVAVSATTVAPGAEFTISGADCLSTDPDQDAVVVVMSEDGDIYEELFPGSDGSWSVTTAFPEGMAAGDQLMLAVCDWYSDGLYTEFTMTVTGSVGAIRGVEAITPGTRAVSDDRTSTSSTPGQKVVRIIAGFQPGEKVTLVMHSTPVVLGTFTADAQGVVTAAFALPAGAVAGTHTFVYEGDMGTYFQESFTVTGGEQLARTGADVTVPVTVGLGLVLTGAGALVVSRRRTPGAMQA
jgi:LPXTG-motif cell wall-anchored protein